MSARPSTTQADLAAGEQPMLERPMGRRTLLRAMIITVPVVAAFSRNAWAASIGCIPGCEKCANNGCLPSGCIQKGKTCNNGQCNNFKCAAVGALLRNDSQNGSLTGGPLGGSQPAINDGGFNSSPWQ
ncbi:MAG: hypothetical protein V4503_01855 [Gemmatimonadota bacterium]